MSGGTDALYDGNAFMVIGDIDLEAACSGVQTDVAIGDVIAHVRDSGTGALGAKIAVFMTVADPQTEGRRITDEDALRSLFPTALATQPRVVTGDPALRATPDPSLTGCVVLPDEYCGAARAGYYTNVPDLTTREYVGIDLPAGVAIRSPFAGAVSSGTANEASPIGLCSVYDPSGNSTVSFLAQGNIDPTIQSLQVTAGSGLCSTTGAGAQVLGAGVVLEYTEYDQAAKRYVDLLPLLFPSLFP